MAEDMVGPDVAEQEFTRFLVAMDLVERTDSKGLDADDRKAFEANKQTILGAMRRGSLIVDDSGEPVFTPVKSDDKKPIRFREPTGATMKAADQAKNGSTGERSILIMSAITGELPSRFVKMVRRDLAICEALTLVFFA